MKKMRHGLRYTREYETWLNMKNRCYNTNNNTYEYYGGRGIVLCDRWVDNFQNFYDDMGKRPEGDYEIDRTDNDKNYSPANCKWVKKIVNARNKRNSKWWFVNGVRYESLTHASESLGVTFTVIKKWCDGRTDGGYTYPPKTNCWSELKYNERN